jgi:hypothetical protein
MSLEKMSSLPQNFHLQEINTDDFEFSVDTCKFQKEIIEVFTCLICLNLANNPRCCSYCEGITCKRCTEQIKKTNHLCPKGCGKRYQVRELTLTERFILNSIGIDCVYNCGTVSKYEFLKQHLATCQNAERIGVCVCGAEIATNNFCIEIMEHVDKCPEVDVSCPDCGNQVKRKKLTEHERVCEYRMIKCEDCGFKCQKIEMPLHDRPTCARLMKEEFRRSTQEMEAMWITRHNEMEALLRNKFQEEFEINKTSLMEKVAYLEQVNLELKDAVKMSELTLKNKDKELEVLKSGVSLVGLDKEIIEEVGDDEILPAKRFTNCISIDAHLDSVYCAIQLSNGDIATGSFDSLIKIWNVKQFTCEFTLESHSSSVFCLIQLLNGKLVSGSSDCTIKIWITYEYIYTITCSKPIECLVELQNGNIASGLWNNTISIWDSSKYTCINTLKGHSDIVTTLINMPDNQLASGSCDSSIRVWDLNLSSAYTLKGHTKAVRSLFFRSDKLYSCSWDKTIKIWKNKKILRTINAHDDYVTGIIDYDRRFISASFDRTVKIWGKNGKLEEKLSANSYVNRLIKLIDGRLIAGCKDGTILIWDYTFE